MPPGGVDAEEGETLSYISGHYRIFQFERGHRFSTDDVLTAWYGTQWAPRVERAADLGSGIGSVAIVTAWRLPGASFCTIEAQPDSVRLARKSIRYNGLSNRFTVLEGDLRDRALLASHAPFDLVLGSPPYYPPGTATAATHPQAVPARIEMRGTVADYAESAAAVLAPGGLFAFVFPAPERSRAETALRQSGLTLIRSRDVVFREGEAPRITLFAASRAGDLPVSFDASFDEPPLVIRTLSGSLSGEYAAVRLSFGFPPDVPEPSS
jgi:tRNA1(Val) A37 N6-methylase TrmN6